LVSGLIGTPDPPDLDRLPAADQLAMLAACLQRLELKIDAVAARSMELDRRLVEIRKIIRPLTLAHRLVSRLPRP
jgi:hypothetical protein